MPNRETAGSTKTETTGLPETAGSSTSETTGMPETAGSTKNTGYRECQTETAWSTKTEVTGSAKQRQQRVLKQRLQGTPNQR